jgi:amino acid transporter
MFSELKRFLIGAPLNPFNPNTRKHIALIALLAWVGLGADPLSSSCYGPEEAYLALGGHSHLAIYISIMTVFTIFIISMGYNQVIELFPSGGGGYKVATRLLHPYAGLLSGTALVVDYVLTITISIASGTDAVFSFLPLAVAKYKIIVEGISIFILFLLNLRGVKETIWILFPVFIGFVLVHAALIIYGIVSHSEGLMTIAPITWRETREMATSLGWLSVVGLVLHAYSLGSGTYTGIEAISNNVQRLAEPRVRTGKRTMWYMAFSLSFMAGGIILLYLLWEVVPEPGKTLNAVVFASILGQSWEGHIALMMTLLLEAGLLFVAANTGFVDGPNVLANMAVDGWVPNRFRHLSNRLVIQNGLLLFGGAALVMLFITNGKVSLLVVLYSINVFITFTLSLLSITVYWLKHRARHHWYWHCLLSGFAFLITFAILVITILYKFTSGGWITLLITSTLAAFFMLIRRHYQYIARKLKAMDALLMQPIQEEASVPHAIDPQQSTAIIFINNLSVGMHTLLSVMRIFPGQFKNFVFLTAGAVDIENYAGNEELILLQKSVNSLLDYFVKYCSQHGIPAEGYSAFGTDVTEELKLLSDRVAAKYPHAIFFASQLIFKPENMVTRFLHNQTPLILQHHLHFNGRELMIMPMQM